MSIARRKAAQAERGMAKAKASPHDALILLTAGHNEIDKLAQEFERRRHGADRVEKGKLALRLCHALALQAETKRQVFYPAAEAVLEGEAQELLAKLRIEQDELLHLVLKIESMSADSPDFDAAVQVLAERAARHARREEHELFASLRHSRLDLLGTGERMAALQAEVATAPIRRREIRRARKVMAGHR
jgi:hypothetical protein